MLLCCLFTGETRAPRRLRSSRLDGCRDRKSTRLNSSHSQISYAVFCLKKKTRYPPRYKVEHRQHLSRLIAIRHDISHLSRDLNSYYTQKRLCNLYATNIRRITSSKTL